MAVPGLADTVSLVLPSQVASGSTFDIQVNLTDIFSGRPADTLIAFGFNFTYDTTALSLVNGTADTGNWFDASDLLASPVQIIGINFVGFTSGSTVEPLALATLTMRALKPGVTNFSLTSDPLDLNTGIVFDSLPYGAINVSSSVNVVVPEPAAWQLFGIVLLAVWVLFRGAFPGSLLSRSH